MDILCYQLSGRRPGDGERGLREKGNGGLIRKCREESKG